MNFICFFLYCNQLKPYTKYSFKKNLRKNINKIFCQSKFILGNCSESWKARFCKKLPSDRQSELFYPAKLSYEQKLSLTEVILRR